RFIRGPMPSSTSSASAKSARPALKYSSSCGVSPGSGWPAAGAPPRTPGSCADEETDCDDIFTSMARRQMAAAVRTTSVDDGGWHLMTTRLLTQRECCCSCVDSLGNVERQPAWQAGGQLRAIAVFMHSRWASTFDVTLNRLGWGRGDRKLLHAPDCVERARCEWSGGFAPKMVVARTVTLAC